MKSQCKNYLKTCNKIANYGLCYSGSQVAFWNYKSAHIIKYTLSLKMLGHHNSGQRPLTPGFH
eukprot:14714677-Ditylum_brightwellii.AAC.1